MHFYKYSLYLNYMIRQNLPPEDSDGSKPDQLKLLRFAHANATERLQEGIESMVRNLMLDGGELFKVHHMDAAHRYIQGKSKQEIAREVGRTRRTVERWLQYIEEYLRGEEDKE